MSIERRTPTSHAQLDRVVRDLSQRQRDWVNTGLRERAGFLQACIAAVRAVAREWVQAGCQAQRIDPTCPLAGEHWLSGPVVTLRCLRLTAESLHRGARPQPAWSREHQGQQIVGVVPTGHLEKALFSGVRAEIWIEPGKPATQGRIYRRKEGGEEGRGGVALVLGAGNVSSIAPRDLVHKLFVEDEVVVLKMHPVNEYLGPIFERAFAPLILGGYLAIVYGGAETGSYLCRHELVDSIHLTGSHHTHDAIVWGNDEQERARRKAAREPVIDKPVTSELGCVSPVIVVPGEWSDGDLDRQARSVAGMVVNNASFNCNAAKAIVLQQGWPQREQFLERLRGALAAAPQRYAYYPGAQERYERFRDRYPDSEPLGGDAQSGCLPWTIIPEVKPERGEYALTHEAFCGMVAEVALPAADPEDFLSTATDFVNDAVWGSLSCMLLLDPSVERSLGARLQEAIGRLRYGGVAVNSWSGYLFALSATSWGAYPGNPLTDVRSGIGTVGNTMLFDHPQKSVVVAPFGAWPKPVWFPDHRTLASLGERLADMETAPAWRRLPRLALAAARG